MNRLCKYVEVMPFGIRTQRVAYAMTPSALPEPRPDAEWRKVEIFNAGDELLNDPGLKEVFRSAIKNGCETVNGN